MTSAFDELFTPQTPREELEDRVWNVVTEEHSGEIQELEDMQRREIERQVREEYEDKIQRKTEKVREKYERKIQDEIEYRVESDVFNHATGGGHLGVEIQAADKELHARMRAEVDERLRKELEKVA